MVKKFTMTLMFALTTFVVYGQPDTQTKNDISVSIEDWAPFAHKFVVDNIAVSTFLNKQLYPLKIIVTNNSDIPVNISPSSIGGLQSVSIDHVLRIFPAKQLLGLALSAPMVGVGLVGLTGPRDIRITSSIILGLGMLTTGILAYSGYVSTKKLKHSFENVTLYKEKTIEAGSRFEAFIFLTQEGYNAKMANITLVNAHNTHDVLAFAFHL